MTERFIALIPADPTLRLEATVLARLENAHGNACDSRQTRAKDFGQRMQFIDCGTSQEGITCPECKADASTEWWGHRMDHAWDNDKGFHFCSFEMPCCGAHSSLEKLIYRPKQGFSTWFVSARVEGDQTLSKADIAALEAIAGAKLIAVHQTY